MSEIKKMYDNAGVKPEINYVCDKEPCEQHSVDCQKCSHLYDTREDYPDFTAEKQIELIKLLAKGEIKIDNTDGEYEFSIFDTISDFSSFEESLADLTNRMWQSLTPEEKQQVKGILE